MRPRRRPQLQPRERADAGRCRGQLRRPVRLRESAGRLYRGDALLGHPRRRQALAADRSRRSRGSVATGGSFVYAVVSTKTFRALLMRSPVDRDRLDACSCRDGARVRSLGAGTAPGRQVAAARRLPRLEQPDPDNASQSDLLLGPLLQPPPSRCARTTLRRQLATGAYRGAPDATDPRSPRPPAGWRDRRSTDRPPTPGSGWSQVAGLLAQAFSATGSGSDHTHGWPIGGTGRGPASRVLRRRHADRRRGRPSGARAQPPAAGCFKRVVLPIADSGWSVAFLNSRDGLALGRFGESANPIGRLYYTSDGGASVHPYSGCPGAWTLGTPPHPPAWRAASRPPDALCRPRSDSRSPG